MIQTQNYAWNGFLSKFSCVIQVPGLLYNVTNHIKNSPKLGNREFRAFFPVGLVPNSYTIDDWRMDIVCLFEIINFAFHFWFVHVKLIQLHQLYNENDHWDFERNKTTVCISLILSRIAKVYLAAMPCGNIVCMYMYVLIHIKWFSLLFSGFFSLIWRKSWKIESSNQT